LVLKETLAAVEVVIPTGAEVIATDGLVCGQKMRTAARRRPERRSRAIKIFRTCLRGAVNLLNETR
jgi:hypothetical protein